jgi:hypothetical protein
MPNVTDRTRRDSPPLANEKSVVDYGHNAAATTLMRSTVQRRRNDVPGVR